MPDYCYYYRCTHTSRRSRAQTHRQVQIVIMIKSCQHNQRAARTSCDRMRAREMARCGEWQRATKHSKHRLLVHHSCIGCVYASSLICNVNLFLSCLSVEPCRCIDTQHLVIFRIVYSRKSTQHESRSSALNLQCEKNEKLYDKNEWSRRKKMKHYLQF